MAHLDQTVIRLLAARALEARAAAYCPYSGYAVGAALLCSGGRIFTGCNLESAAFSPGICAERAALAGAVSAGYRQFQAIAVAGGLEGAAPEDSCYPCGVCRQSLREFCGEEFTVILVKSPDDVQLTTLGELLPHSFSGENLRR